MTSAPISFRTATADDAATLAACGERMFRATFRPHNRPADLDAYCLGAFGDELQRRELLDPGRHSWFAILDGAIAGYGQLRAGPPPPCVTGEAPIELLRFYVDERWHGRGVAPALMARAIEAARQRGARTLYLAVWEHNRRAIAFYAKHGFAQVGSVAFMMGTDRQTDHVMIRPV